ncbi:FUSC family protein [Acidicapsa acidisoli]|uniref:FUSC family protein n=1 Tax=Acidicapsa acidisoli TaxID=1615681 RepID=UPI0021DF8E70|nr:FUSC family protein [Acidicapsa acidisoli]
MIDIAETSSPEGWIAWIEAKRSLERVGVDEALYLPLLTFAAQGRDTRLIFPFPMPIAPREYVTVEEPLAQAQLELQYSLLDFSRKSRHEGSKALEIAPTLQLSRVHQTIAYNTAIEFYRVQQASGQLDAAMTTGAIRQKQLYRLAGALLGGVLGIATVSLLYPNMDSISSLIIVVAAVSFLSGWVLRSPRMSYVVVQIGFGFFLTALLGFSSTSNISPARDRVIGVALGILVMWFIFDQLWLSRTSDVLCQCLVIINSATNQLRRILEHCLDAADRIHFNALRESVSSELANVDQLEFGVYFEGGQHRAREIARTRHLIREIESSAGEFYLLAKDLSHASFRSRSP